MQYAVNYQYFDYDVKNKAQILANSHQLHKQNTIMYNSATVFAPWEQKTVLFGCYFMQCQAIFCKQYHFIFYIFSITTKLNLED